MHVIENKQLVFNLNDHADISRDLQELIEDNMQIEMNPAEMASLPQNDLFAPKIINPTAVTFSNCIGREEWEAGVISG